MRWECEWDMEDIKDDNFGGKLQFNRLIVLLVVVCFILIVFFVLMLFIFFGLVGVINCFCNDNLGKLVVWIRFK